MKLSFHIIKGNLSMKGFIAKHKLKGPSNKLWGHIENVRAYLK